jgi:hypothetical protein
MGRRWIYRGEVHNVINRYTYTPFQTDRHPSLSLRPALLELLEIVEPIEHDVLGRLLDLAREEDFVEDGVDFVKVEDEVELANVLEEGIWRGTRWKE